MNNRPDIKSDFAAALLLEKLVRGTYSDRGSQEIQPLQWSILRYTQRNPEHRCTMSWIKSYLGLTHAPVVRAIATLVKRGFVVQKQNPDDARSNVLTLSDIGLAMLDDDPILEIVELISELPRREREQFRKSVRALTTGMDRSDTADNEIRTTH